MSTTQPDPDEVWEDNEQDLQEFGQPDEWDGQDEGDSGTEDEPVVKPGNDVT